MEISDEELEAIKMRSYNLGMISATLDEILILIRALNGSFDESFKKIR